MIQNNKDKEESIIKNEIFSKNPPEILGQSIVFIAASLFLLFLILSFINYPDILISQVTIKSNFSTQLRANSNGVIDTIFKLSNQRVKKDEYVFVLKNSANTNDIIRLKYLIDHTDSTDFKMIINLPLNYELGDLQDKYINLKNSYENYNKYIQQNLIKLHINNIKKEKKILNESYNCIEVQKKISMRELKIFQDKFSRDSLLFKVGTLSLSDYESSELELLQKKIVYENLSNELHNIKIALLDLDEQLQNYIKEHKDKIYQLETDIFNSISITRNGIKDWELQNCIIATTDGELIYNGSIQKGKIVNSGDILCIIIPSKGQKIEATAILPPQGAGKVEKDQKIVIELEDYPPYEFGVITGTVGNKYYIPSDNYYIFNIDLTNGLLTSYGINIDSKQEIKGIGKIITNDVSILRKLILPIKYLKSK
ncbi:MAG: hypothetical protein ACFFDF_09295 [Candidatus Odinarchaeota archaeon]